MAMTKMFRDRVVSMEQTWELGEKYLEILAELVHEALPRFRVTGNDFDHDRDFYFLTVASEEVEEKRVSFTRMVLADRACIPLVVEEPHAPVKARLLDAIRAQAEAAEIVVAFRSILSDEEKAEADEIDAAWRAEEAVREAARKVEEEKRREEKRRQREAEEGRRRSQREKSRAHGGEPQAQPQRGGGEPAGEGRGKRRRRGRGRGGKVEGAPQGGGAAVQGTAQPSGPRPSGDQARGDSPRGDRRRGDRSRNDRPRNDRPQDRPRPEGGAGAPRAGGAQPQVRPLQQPQPQRAEGERGAAGGNGAREGGNRRRRRRGRGGNRPPGGAPGGGPPASGGA